MKLNELKNTMQDLQLDYHDMNGTERYAAAQMLIKTASLCVEQLRKGMCEGNAATNRRKAKRRETEVDPKPPVSPVSVAEPSKPTKPKYSGG
jgi:hypothetical protein